MKKILFLVIMLGGCGHGDEPNNPSIRAIIGTGMVYDGFSHIKPHSQQDVVCTDSRLMSLSGHVKSDRDIIPMRSIVELHCMENGMIEVIVGPWEGFGKAIKLNRVGD
jgi:hypothetical protein